jgi:hypothetical protein
MPGACEQQKGMCIVPTRDRDSTLLLYVETGERYRKSVARCSSA